MRRLGVHPWSTLAAALFAVLAMHGLSSHELAHGASATAAVPVAAAAAGHVDLEHRHGVNAPGEQGEDGPSPDRDVEGGVCLALLCLLAGLLALRLRRGLRPCPPWVLRRVNLGLLSAGRPADPPCLHRLSIMRC